jgi:AraC-like DNA-binding protein
VIAILQDEVLPAALQFIRQARYNGMSVDRVALSRCRLKKGVSRSRRAGPFWTKSSGFGSGGRNGYCSKRSTPIAKVAPLAGFGSTGCFVQLFQDRVGQTPGNFGLALTI